jgi:hypothetical protein
MRSGFSAQPMQKAGKLDHIRGDDARHFGGFAAGEDAVAGFQIIGHAGNQAGDLLLIERAMPM